MTEHTATNTFGFQPRHAEILEKSAIPVEQAAIRGIHSLATAKEQLRANWPQLAYLASEGDSGILFTHRTIQGKEVVQYRPDEPHGDAKYVFVKGVGSVLSVQHNAAQRLEDGTAKRILIVEGTKQAIAADIYSAPTDAVIGIQGIYGWSSEGVPNPDLAILAARVKDFVIVPDADVAINPTVWEGAKRLGAHLKSLGAKVSYASVPAQDDANGKSGVDDLLGVTRDEGRVSTFALLINGASNKLPRKPTRSAEEAAPQLAPIVDWANARIGRIVQDIDLETGDTKTSFKAIAKFAARIVETLEVRDDLNDPMGLDIQLTHTLEVVTQARWGTDREEETDELRQVHILRGVRDEDLAKPSLWLRRLGAEGASVDRQTGLQADQAIGQAIATDAVQSRETIQHGQRHTGWQNIGGKEHYLHAEGAINANGNSDAGIAVLSAFSVVKFRAPEGELAKVRALEGFQFLPEALQAGIGSTPAWRTPAIAILGAACWSLAGLKNEHAVFIHAVGAQGKSVTMETVVRSIRDDISMTPSGSTGTAVADAGQGLHHGFAVVDDVLRERSSKREEEQAEWGVDILARRAYSGPSAGARGRSEKGPDGKYAPAKPEMSHPTFFVAGERIPNGGSDSGLQRFFGVEFYGLDAGMTRDEANIDLLRDFWGYFLQNMAMQRDGGVKAFQAAAAKRLDERTAELVERLGDRLGQRGEKFRRARVLALVQLGYILGARTVGLAETAIAADLALLEEAALAWKAVSSARRDDGAENVLETLRVATATSNRYIMTDRPIAGNTHQQVIARVGESKGQKTVFLVPDVAIEALGWTREPNATERLKRAMSSVAQPDKVKVRLTPGRDGVSVWAYAIPAEVWGLEDSEEEDDGAQY